LNGQRTAYLTPEGYAAELQHELGAIELTQERLLVAPGPARRAAWAQNIWLDPVEIAVESIGDAAKKLRAIQRNWAVYAPRLHRRATLIQEQLPAVSARPFAGAGSWRDWVRASSASTRRPSHRKWRACRASNTSRRAPSRSIRVPSALSIGCFAM
jgi:hypothetical protein